jgi:hypothetical protein
MSHENIENMEIQNSEFYEAPTFITSGIGSYDKIKDKKKYIEDQQKLIDRSRERLPPKYNTKKNDIYTDTYLSDPRTLISRNNTSNTTNTEQNNSKDNAEKYNPYQGYLHNQGLIGYNTNTKYTVDYIMIDSSTRIKIPSMNIGTVYYLALNPLLFTQNSNIITINHTNHTFSKNDRILIEGVNPTSVTLKTTGLYYYDVESAVTINTGSGPELVGELTIEQGTGNLFSFINDSEYMTIYYTHFLPYEVTYTKPDANTVVFQNDPLLDNLDATNLLVQITGIQSNDVNGGAFFDNLPLNIINTTHQVILKDPITGRIHGNVFYVKLQKKFVATSVSGFIPPNPAYNFNLNFYYSAGIPNNQINAKYPITSDYLQGFQVITSTTKNSYTIKINTNSTGLRDTVTGKLLIAYTGGSTVKVTSIDDIQKNYLFANQYNIKLGKIFTNVVMVRITSSEFPNTETVVKSQPSNKKNNALYWQNLDDGDYIYSIQLNSGNYTTSDYMTEIQKLFLETPRINYTKDNPTNPPANFKRKTAPYTNKNYITVDINSQTDKVTFTCYKEVILRAPITAVSPTIQPDALLDLPVSINYILTITHTYHSLSVGDTIVIQNATSHMGIPIDNLNTSHVITAVLTANTYQITLPLINLNATRTNTGGGNIVTILSPCLFRMRFDFKDTLGNIFGFRDVAQNTSIFPYQNIITNYDAYYNEPIYDVAGDLKVFKSNSLNFSGDSYITMVCDQFTGVTKTGLMTGTGVIKDAFTKILLNDIPSKVLFNTFVPITGIFYEPITQLADLDIKFYSPDGTLFDFNGLDHSFTLELTTLSETPEESNISSRTGRII